MIIWEIYSGKLPWAGVPPMQIAIIVITEQRRLDLPRCPPEIEALLAACWEHEPTLRPTMQKIEEDFPEEEEEREHSRASAFAHAPSAYSLSSQLTLSAGTTSSQVRGCGITPFAQDLRVGPYSLSSMGWLPIFERRIPEVVYANSRGEAS